MTDDQQQFTETKQVEISVRSQWLDVTVIINATLKNISNKLCSHLYLQHHI